MIGKASDQGQGKWLGAWNRTSQDPLQALEALEWNMAGPNPALDSSLPPSRFSLEGMGFCLVVSRGSRNMGTLQGWPGLLGCSGWGQPEVAYRALLLGVECACQGAGSVIGPEPGKVRSVESTTTGPGASLQSLRRWPE